MFTRQRVALPTFIQPYHPAPCSPMYRRRRRRSRYNSSCPIYTRTQAPSRQDILPSISLTTTPPPRQSISQTNPDSLSLLSLAGQQSTPLLSIKSILPLLQVRTATGRDSPDRYDNLIDLAPLLHNIAILPREISTSPSFSVS